MTVSDIFNGFLDKKVVVIYKDLKTSQIKTMIGFLKETYPLLLVKGEFSSRLIAPECVKEMKEARK